MRPRRRKRKPYLILLLVVALVGAYLILKPSKEEKISNQLRFDASVTEAEQQTIKQAVADQNIALISSVNVSVKTVLETENPANILAVFVPVTDVYAARQSVAVADLGKLAVSTVSGTSETVRTALATALALDGSKLPATYTTGAKIAEGAVVFVPADSLTYKLKLLALNDNYYLDSFQKGAVFRVAEFSGGDTTNLSSLKFNSLPTTDTVLKVNMTGVTALTRLMMRKLTTVKDPLYFSKNIGAFLKGADITHVSNEVSFKAGCSYSDTSFCSHPDFIKTLQDSGVNLVELTGNHNNDTGNIYNTETINLYHSLGINTFGGGLNEVEAAKPYIADQKGSKVAFLGYNYADSPNSGAIAKATTAGANGFDFDKIKTDIAAAKLQAQFVIIDVQFWECYAYPNGFVEYPVCDEPIGQQEEVFKKLADLGADMVIGTQAHQPQTYEHHNDKPIYYGLGNLYFDQDRWPGTERGIILTHYFSAGKLLQTKLTPTRYDSNYQTAVMSDADAVKLLQRLSDAR